MTAVKTSSPVFSWLRIARPLALMLGAALTMLSVYSYVVTAQLAIQDPSLVIPDSTLWTAEQLGEVLAGLGLPGSFYTFYALAITLVFGLIFLACGWLILLRKNRDWFGIFLALLLLSWANGVGVFISMPVAPGVETANLYLGWFVWPGLFLLLYLFPSGQVTPRWARWFAWGWALFAAFGLAASILGQLSDSIVYFLPLLFAVLLVGVYAQIYRFRHAGAAERQQIKMVVFALVLMAAYFVLSSLIINFSGLGDPRQSVPSGALVLSIVLSLVGYLVFMGIPISISLAILRYRLWDIDLIIRKTLVYSLLTATLGLFYFGAVTLAQSLFVATTGEQSPVAIVISTLLIAALFTPLRRRFQDIINRRFYRRRYDSGAALNEFKSRVREEVDLETISRALLYIVEETVQPERVSLWLKEPSTSRPQVASFNHRRQGPISIVQVDK
ncbi:MAG: hypothetical protein R3335_06465 [Anaerolineales bacterium]|nr:hypothetical protein [Anaerolineales bacterium]